MRKWILLSAVALAFAATATIAFASTALPTVTPQPVEAGASAQVDSTTAITESAIVTGQAYLSVDLSAGFPLDPFFVSVNGGGPVDASTLDAACSGFISQAPIVSLDWEGETEMARIFYFSDHNPSLAIEMPDGSFMCNDNASRIVRDPSIQLENPEKGTYRIWVGNEDGEGLIPGVLVITTKDQFSAGSFQLQGFIKRPAVRAELVTAMDALPEGAVLKTRLAEILADEEGLPVLEEGADITRSVEFTGDIPGFVWPVSADSPDALCSGVSAGESQLDFVVAEGTESVRILFDGAADAGLIVFTPAGDALCQDDSEEGANRNPVLDIVSPEPGNYAILVSRIADVDVLTGTVTVTTDMERTPSMLEPEESTGTSN